MRREREREGGREGGVRHNMEEDEERERERERERVWGGGCGTAWKKMRRKGGGDKVGSMSG